MQAIKHFLIYERYTEEEFVATLSDLLLECGHKVSLYVSDRIWDLLKNTLDKEKFQGIIIFPIGTDFNEIYFNISGYIESSKADVVFFPSFLCRTFREFYCFKKFTGRFFVCSLIADYYRWFARFPKIQFGGKKIIKARRILDWYFCRSMFRNFSSYFLTEIHPDSENPLKSLIRKKSNKPILDLPFKIPEREYCPPTDFEYPIFIIPGSIWKERRDYFKILGFFQDMKWKDHKWKLILLGRPKEKYGNRVIKKAKEINRMYDQKRIEYIESYISKEEFGGIMQKGTHIIAPVSKSGYTHGKDSGAVYDVFKYNKIGIFDRSYFYSVSLEELKVIITYKDNTELYNILAGIIKKTFDYKSVSGHFKSVSEMFSRKVYLDYLKEQVEKHF